MHGELSVIELDDALVARGLPAGGVFHNEKFSVRPLRVLKQLEGSVRLGQLEQHGAVLLDLLDQGCPIPLEPIAIQSIEIKPGGHRQ